MVIGPHNSPLATLYKRLHFLILFTITIVAFINISTVHVFAANFDLNDKSGNSNNLTNSGTTDWTTDTPFADSSHAIKAVSASNQFLYAPDSASLSVTGSLTVEEWIKFDALPTPGNEVFFADKYRDDNNQISWTFALQNNGGTYRFRALTSTTGSNYDIVTENWTPSTGVWYHVAMVYDANVPNIKFYVDGVQQGSTQSKSFSSIYDSTATLQIGVVNHGGSPSQYLDGKIDELRIWNIARTAAQINNDMNVELTGTETGLVAYYSFETLPPFTDIRDKSSNTNNLINKGATDWISDTPFAASSHAVKTIADSYQFLYAPDSSSLSVTGSLTVEEWVKFDALPTPGNEVFFADKYRDDNNQISWTFALQNNGGTYRFRALTSTNGSNYEDVTTNWTPSLNTWYHVAMVYDASVPNVKFYVNGSQQGATQSKSFSSIYDSTATMQIGVVNHGGSPSQYLDGKIDELRIWNIARTASDINNNKSIELIGAESGLVAYYPFESLSKSINAGGASSGNFLADQEYSGGSSYSSTNTVDTSSVIEPAPQAVYKTVRYGNFTYTIANLKPNSDYTVRLHFNELYWGTSNSGGVGGVGSRVFDVSINGSQVLNDYDIFQEAGGADKAIVEEFVATSNGSGEIGLQLTTVTDNAMINGIELIN